jgi:hypothetical protein
MKTVLFVTVLLLSACGNSEPPKAPEPAAAAQSADASAPAPAKGDAGALTPDKK